MAIEAKLEGNKLTIVANLDGKTASKSGKSIILASTGGFLPVSAGTEYSLNVIKKKV